MKFLTRSEVAPPGQHRRARHRERTERSHQTELESYSDTDRRRGRSEDRISGWCHSGHQVHVYVSKPPEDDLPRTRRQQQHDITGWTSSKTATADPPSASGSAWRRRGSRRSDGVALTSVSCSAQRRRSSIFLLHVLELFFSSLPYLLLLQLPSPLRRPSERGARRQRVGFRAARCLGPAYRRRRAGAPSRAARWVPRCRPAPGSAAFPGPPSAHPSQPPERVARSGNVLRRDVQLQHLAADLVLQLLRRPSAIAQSEVDHRDAIASWSTSSKYWVQSSMVVPPSGGRGSAPRGPAGSSGRARGRLVP